MVNVELQIYLTDFLDAAFVGENAKNHALCAGMIVNTRRVYRANIKHVAISTRSVDDLVKALGMSGISKSQVSRLCEEIGERVKTFLGRPIEGARARTPRSNPD